MLALARADNDQISTRLVGPCWQKWELFSHADARIDAEAGAILEASFIRYNQCGGLGPQTGEALRSGMRSVRAHYARSSAAVRTVSRVRPERMPRAQAPAERPPWRGGRPAKRPNQSPDHWGSAERRGAVPC